MLSELLPSEPDNSIDEFSEAEDGNEKHTTEHKLSNILHYMYIHTGIVPMIVLVGL